MIRLTRQSIFIKIITIIFLSFIMGFGISFFLEPSHLISTGLTGIIQLIEHYFPISFGVLYLTLNIPGLALSYFKLGKMFTLYSIISIIVVTLTTDILPHLVVTNAFTSDRLVNSLFAGTIMGFSIGGLLKIGASSGGFDFFCLYAFQKKGIPFSYINLPINMVIIIIAAFTFGIETTLFTIIFIIIREIVLNLCYTNNQKMTVWIIGEDLGQVSDYIQNNLGRGTSIFNNVEGGYTHGNKQAMMVVLNKYQYMMLKEDIYNINPHVFICANKTYDVIGNYRVNQ